MSEGHIFGYSLTVTVVTVARSQSLTAAFCRHTLGFLSATTTTTKSLWAFLRFRSFVRSFIRLFVRLFVRLLVGSLVGWLVGWLVRSFVRSRPLPAFVDGLWTRNGHGNCSRWW